MISVDITNVSDYWNWFIQTKHKLCRLWWMCCKQRMLKQIQINTCSFFPFITFSPVLRGKCFHIIVVRGQKTGMILILVWEPQQVDKVSKGTQTCILGNNEQLCFDRKFYQIRRNALCSPRIFYHRNSSGLEVPTLIQVPLQNSFV